MLLMPESPRWLGKKYRYDDALKVIKQIYNEDEVQNQMDLLKKEV
jgi:hypothetical protein